MKRFFIMIVASAVFLTACAGPRWVRTPVVKDRNFVIALEHCEEKGAVVTGAYTHPYEVASEDLGMLMRGLTYVERGGLQTGEQTGHVFQAEEIDRLAPALAGALNVADGSQRIRFISYKREKALIFYVSRETEGVVFTESGNRLNMAFSRINSEIDPDSVNDFYEDFSRMDPLDIRSADTVLNPIHTFGWRKELDTGNDAPMWITVDIDAMKQAVASAPAVNSNVSQGRDSSNDVPAVKPDVPAAASVVPSTAAAMETLPAVLSDDQIKEDIKSKLKYLKELLDEGLISEKDYDAKKSELLEKIP